METIMPNRLFAALLAASIALPTAALAAEPTPPRVIVVGEGEMTVAPDMALLSLSVMREAATAREALDASNDAIAAVIAAMKAAGVAERDLQTSNLQINPRYDYVTKPDGTQEGRLAAYQVTNTLAVRLLDKAVTLGVNQGGSITFTNDDPAATITEARKKAVADAMAKAKTLAEAGGVALGRIIEMSEMSYTPMPVSIEAKTFDAAPRAVPIATGENAYRVQVNVTFELK
jgi:uncharacterized protein YggE